MPWDALENDYAEQFCKGFGALAKPFRIALGAVIINARLGLTDEKIVEQIKENPYLQFFIGLEALRSSAPFDPSMMVYFRKRLLEAVVNGCNERIVRPGLKVIRSSDTEGPGDDNGSGGGSTSLRWSGFSGQVPSFAFEAGYRP
jgi:IS5 family transposase